VRKEQIIEVLNDWNLWGGDIESGTPRDAYVNKARTFLHSGQVVTVAGVRRSGKSFILRQLLKELAKETGARNALLVNFEDYRLTAPDLKLLESIYRLYLERIRPGSKPFILLDEVHLVKGWERWVRTIHELGKARLVVTGSTSKLMSPELATKLTGRHLDVTVMPLGFREYLEFNGLRLEDELDIIAQRDRIRGLLHDYMRNGGFPAVVGSRSPVETLRTIYNDILEKDVLQRYPVRKTGDIRKLARFLLTNFSSLHTHSSAAKWLGLTAVTAEKFSRYLEEVFLIFPVRRFSFSVKEQERAPRKIYSIDPGLSNAVGFQFSENLGRIAENVVAIELRRRLLENPLLELYHWRDQYGKEVDFIVKDGELVSQLIQMCWNLDDPGTKKREIGSLLKAMRLFGLKQGLVITEELEDEETAKGKKISYRPLWKWLLETGSLSPTKKK
jgi:hypothetical protein